MKRKDCSYIYVDREFKKMLKDSANKEDLSLIRYTRKIAKKKRGNKIDYDMEAIW